MADDGLAALDGSLGRIARAEEEHKLDLTTDWAREHRAAAEAPPEPLQAAAPTRKGPGVEAGGTQPSNPPTKQAAQPPLASSPLGAARQRHDAAQEILTRRHGVTACT